MGIRCISCGEFVEVPSELVGNAEDLPANEGYLCDACERDEDDEHPEWNVYIRLYANSYGQ